MRRDQITAERLAALNAGAEARVLTECLAVDFAQLMGRVAPEVEAERLRAKADAGIVARMQLAGEMLRGLGALRLTELAGSPSDTVRGWVAFAQMEAGLGFEALLTRALPFADDPHFGVREWAWMALRPALITDLEGALTALLPLTQSTRENLRRFACEISRPRGVWCAHLKALKDQPERGFALLEPLKADPSRYVQDSVANWLNDAAKSRPDTVKALLARWAKAPCKATDYICKRAARSL